MERHPAHNARRPRDRSPVSNKHGSSYHGARRRPELDGTLPASRHNRRRSSFTSDVSTSAVRSYTDASQTRFVFETLLSAAHELEPRVPIVRPGAWRTVRQVSGTRLTFAVCPAGASSLRGCFVMRAFSSKGHHARSCGTPGVWLIDATGASARPLATGSPDFVPEGAPSWSVRRTGCLHVYTHRNVASISHRCEWRSGDAAYARGEWCIHTDMEDGPP